MAVSYRLSKVFRMEEFKSERSDIIEGQPLVHLDNAEYAWGFRVSEEQKKSRKLEVKLEVETNNNSVLRNLTLTLMKDELLVVVGKIGSGKTSFLYSLMDETVKKSG